jgi:hypothetical protein
VLSLKNTDLDAGVNEDQVLIEFNPHFLTSISCGVGSGSEKTPNGTFHGKRTIADQPHFVSGH